MSRPKLHLVLEQLRRARSFEDAASTCARAIASIAASALRESRRDRSRVLRAVVHLRPDGYRKLWLEGVDARDATSSRMCLPSATAWRFVQRGAAVSIDVHVGVLRLYGEEPTCEGAEDGAPPSSTELEAHGTRERLLRRDATHVFVMPLRLPGGAVCGMISVEVECRAAINRDFIWEHCGEEMQRLADVAAPFVDTLPSRPADESTTDDLLPVIGAATSPLVDLLRVFATQEETITLHGPTGVGKSRLARWCHAQSERSEGPFETLNLVSVPDALQMAELFGWRRGAFTGAVRDNEGAVARADGGTLFIDEIDKLSLATQAGLLRLLEERVYRPVGRQDGDANANVRFVVGTTSDLHQAMRAGSLRPDLYYRINVLPVRVPPLADRLDELPRWARYMLARRHDEARGARQARLGADVDRLLVAARWPGNLRQLDNVVRRSYALSLLERGEREGDVVVEARHVERALAQEGLQSHSLFRRLVEAAEALAAEIDRRAFAGDLAVSGMPEAFVGLVMRAMVRRMGDRDEAFRALGLGHLLKNRNHHRVLRRELARADELERTLTDAASSAKSDGARGT